ncbi:MAG: hypothetical protein Q8P46_10870 [Hyphomicrobiales bacterium]|nr:hypothetical protein [Hyphomicrobiales bacterium]
MMRYSHTALSGALLAVAFASPAIGQSSQPVIKPGGSVEATPIEIPGKGRTSATPIEIPGKGRTLATPIEIPGKGVVATLPMPLPSANIERLDPRAYPDRFSALPLPIPDPRASGTVGRFAYRQMADGRVMGQTAYG